MEQLFSLFYRKKNGAERSIAKQGSQVQCTLPMRLIAWAIFYFAKTLSTLVRGNAVKNSLSEEMITWGSKEKELASPSIGRMWAQIPPL